MKTLYENIVSSHVPESHKKIVEAMDQAEIIHIQNVADYWFEVFDDRDPENKTLFPNLAPPFPMFWMEYSMPQMFRAEGRIDKNPNAGTKYGYLFSSQLAPENPWNVKWSIEVLLFCKDKIYSSGKITQPVGWRMGVDESGKLGTLNGEEAFETAFVTATGTRLEAEAFYMLFAPALLAVSFLHCKNVDLIPREPKIGNRKQRNRHAARVKYHVLQIEPMKRILRKEGKAEETGLKHALHICRGHFKDFSKGKGLFGKYQGMFWWDSQVRGKAEHGVVIKDYNIIEPAQ